MDEMMRAWQSIRDKVDFTKQPMWNGQAPPDFTKLCVRDDAPPVEPIRIYSFRIRYLEDRGKLIGAGVFGQLYGTTDWLPVEPVPIEA